VKKCLSLVLSVFVLTTTVNTAQAFNKNHLAQLKKTNQCPKCDLSRANLKGAKLFGAKLSRANLSRANLHKANLSGAKLIKAKLNGAIWTDGRKCAKNSIGQCRKEIRSGQKGAASGPWNPSMGMRHPSRPCMKANSCGRDIRSAAEKKRNPYDIR